jgi:hypothetical protein
MAKRVKHTQTPDIPSAGPEPGEFQRLITEINRQKSLGSEYNGAGGKLTREAIERHGLKRKPFGWVTGLHRTDEAERQATIRAFIDYIERAGFLDQMDAFSDVSEQVIALAERLKGRIPNRERDSDGTVAAVLN